MLEMRGNALFKDGRFVCSQNEVMERFFRFIFHDVPASARCLCTGLGLGLAQRLLLPRQVVTIEYDREIIDDPDGVLAEIERPGDVIHADAFEWQQDREFDFHLADIWSDIHAVPKGDEAKMMKRFDIPVQVCLPSAYKAGGW